MWEFPRDRECHIIEECIGFKYLLQKLMDEQVVQISSNVKKGQLNAIEGNDMDNGVQTSSFSPNTLIIHDN